MTQDSSQDLKVSSNGKAYCICVSAPLHFRPLPNVPGPIFVHANCGFPSKLVWEGHFKRCNTCLRFFSSPWETNCKRCHEELISFKEEKNRPWQGWKWAKELTYSWQEPLTSFEGLYQCPPKPFQGGVTGQSGRPSGEADGSTQADSEQTSGIASLDFDF